ncbi:MAG: alpha/beta fold hydrolase [Pseudonocardiaceae bacterium]
MADVTVGGVRFHVQRLAAPRPAGTRPMHPVVLIHGLGMDNLSSFYYTLANPLANAGAEVIMYDLRGHGLSERSRTGYRVGDSVADLAALLDELGVVGPIHLIGNSYGGTVALAFAVAHPERVASMVLIEAHLTVAGWAEQMEATLCRIGSDLAAGNTQMWLQKYHRKHARMAQRADDLINGTTFLTDLLTVNPINPGSLRTLACPVRAVYGEQSDAVGYAHQLNENLPFCALTVLPGIGHSVLMDATATLREIVLDWLAAHTSVGVR